MEKRRRKASPCVLCKADTQNWDYVCDQCRVDRKSGASIREAQGKLPDGLTDATIAWHWDLYHHYGQVGKWHEGKNDPRAILPDRLRRLVGATESTKNYVGKMLIVGRAKNSQSVITGPSSYYLIHGDESTPILLQEIFEAICDLMADAYRDGLRRGQSFVTDLAEGKMSVKDLERF